MGCRRHPLEGFSEASNGFEASATRGTPQGSPSEVPLAYAGYLVHTTEFNLIVMLIVAVMSFVISQNIFFTILLIQRARI